MIDRDNRRGLGNGNEDSWSDLPVPAGIIDERNPDHSATFAELDAALLKEMSAVPLHAVREADVFGALAESISPMFVTGVKELMEAAEASNFAAHLQFYRRDGTGNPPVVVITFHEKGEGVPGVFGVPNVEIIFDTPDARLQDESQDRAGIKQVKEFEGTESEGSSLDYSGLLKFETFAQPVRVILNASTDPQFSRPFDVQVQYSTESFIEAQKRLTLMLKGSNGDEFNHLFSCVVLRAVMNEMATRYYPQFGERETPIILPGSFWDDDGLHVIAQAPVGYDSDIDCIVALSAEVTANAVVSRVDVVPRENNDGDADVW